MLVLARYTGQTIMINDNIVITILAITDKQVKVGVQAPREIAVHRQEVYEKLKEAQLQRE